MLISVQRASRPLRRRVVAVLSVFLAVTLAVTGCSTTPPEPEPITVTYAPGIASKDVNPLTKVSISAGDDVLTNVVLKSSSGRELKGKYDAARHTWTATEVLGYGRSYTWHGRAEARVPDEGRKAVTLSGSFKTVAPSELISARSALRDGQTVGVAAPIIIQFGGKVTNKADVERALKVTANKPVEGSWAWLSATEEGDRVHYRTKEYWPAFTEVNLSADLYGVDFGDGAYGEKDFSLHFSIGRRQVVKAHVPDHKMVVYRNGKVTMTLPASFGQGNLPRNVTRSGIHVVSELHRTVLMTNPPYYYNVPEHFAVRISNNGEFIHANPQTVGHQGNNNVSNGCVNLSTANAEAYFNSALYGDPVEVTGTNITLSEADGDIWDWAANWEDWKSWSALADESEAEKSPSATDTPSDAPREATR